MRFTITQKQHENALLAKVKGPLEPGQYESKRIGKTTRIISLDTGETFSRRRYENTVRGYTISSVKKVEDWHGWTRYEGKNYVSAIHFMNTLDDDAAVMIVVCGIFLEGWSDLEPGDYGCRTLLSNTRKADVYGKRLQDVEIAIAQRYDTVDKVTIITRDYNENDDDNDY